MKRVAFTVFFRVFALDPHCVGRPWSTRLLCLWSVASIGASIGMLVYMHGVVRLLADPTMLTLISGMYLSTMFGTQSLLVAQALWNRRKLADLLRHLDDVDGVLALLYHNQCNNSQMNNDSAFNNPRRLRRRTPLQIGTIGLRTGCKCIIVMLGFATIYVVYLATSSRWSNTVLYMLAAMATIKVRALQSVFFVDQLAERLSGCNRALRMDDMHQNDDDDDATASETKRNDVGSGGGYARVDIEKKRFDALLAVKGAYDRLWRASDELNAGMGGSWLIIAVETLIEVVVNVYLISSALFTGAVPFGAIRLSLYGVVPTLIVFVLLCDSCERCVQKVRL